MSDKEHVKVNKKHVKESRDSGGKEVRRYTVENKVQFSIHFFSYQAALYVGGHIPQLHRTTERKVPLGSMPTGSSKRTCSFLGLPKDSIYMSETVY